MIVISTLKIPSNISFNIFYTLHPLHVLLSALVTAGIYKKHSSGRFIPTLIIGYIGSVGIATLSDSLIPYLGEILLNMPDRHAHIGFVEKWWLVNPLALIGILIAYYKPTTKFPHSGHVLLSTYASLFHMTMAMGASILWPSYIIVFAFLFVSVWLPCCMSDIVFPLLFIKSIKNPCINNH